MPVNPPRIIYGVQHPNLSTEDGDLKAVEWAKLRAGDNWGQMNDGRTIIIWFYDFQAREDFREIFGGINVTLVRRAENTLTGNQALEALGKASFT